MAQRGNDQIEVGQLLRNVRLEAPLGGFVFAALEIMEISKNGRQRKRFDLHLEHASVERLEDIGALAVVLVERLRQHANLRQLLNLILEEVVHAHGRQVEGLLELRLGHANLLLLQLRALRRLALLTVKVQTAPLQLLSMEL